MEAKTLPNDINLCHTLIAELFESLGKAEKKMGRLQHTIEQLLRNRFGRKSERLEDMDPALRLPVMQDYLKELEAQKNQEQENNPPPQEEEAKETLTYSRKKPKRKPLPKDLPRDTIEYDLEDSEKFCDCCGDPLQRIVAETSEQLDFIPACLRVIEHVCFKYACKGCEKTVVTATKDRQPIEKGIPAAG